MLSSPAGKSVAVVLFLSVLGLAIYSTRAYLKGDTPDTAFSTMYIDSESGKTFQHVNKIGDTLPLLSPFSGKNTAWPAEACYWNIDGSAKKDPDWVLLNSLVGKPEPTFCPVCGRLVVGHNPAPSPGRQAPPTRAEWFAMHPVPAG